MPNTYFISGHLNLTKKEFEEHYIPKIDEALLDENASFIMGDCKGGDTMAQEYLHNKTDKVTVYHMCKKPSNNIGNYKTIGGFQTDNSRDSQMTNDSTHDIAWCREGREGDKSGTGRNLVRREKLKNNISKS